MDHTHFFQLFRLQGRVAGAEIHGFGLRLGDAAAGADGLIIELHAAELVIFMSPLGIDGVGKGGPGPIEGHGLGLAEVYQGEHYYCRD